MSVLTHTDPGTDEGNSADETSPLVMLMTLLLLIAGLLFASILMIQHTMVAQTTDGERLFSLDSLRSAGSSWVSRPIAAASQANDTESTSPTTLDELKQLVSERSSDTLKWPRLKLTGFGSSKEGSDNFAKINGNLVHPGEYVGKVRLVEVRSSDVVVEYMGEYKYLTVELED